MGTILIAYTKTQSSKQTCLTKKREKLSYKLTITFCELQYLQQVNKSLLTYSGQLLPSILKFPFILDQTLKHFQRSFTYVF